MTTTTTSTVMAEAQPPKPSYKLPAMTMVDATDRLTFPHDFPIPKDLILIPFKDFKERGICIEPGPHGDEVDTLGITTVAMKAHDADRCKTNTRRRQKKEEAAKKKKQQNLGSNVFWWEKWEEDEEARIAKPTNATESKVQKFLSAASDFKNGRTWPTGCNQQVDPSFIWSRLEMFLGITGSKLGKSGKKKKSKIFPQLEPELDSEEDDDDYMMGEGDEELVTGKDKKTLAFIRDPETATKIFLSSFARNKGIIWSEINLKQLPLLMKFFLEFLIRSRTFKDAETGFRLAVQVCELALQELPLGFELSADMCPEPFGDACRDVFGRMAEGFKTFTWDGDSGPKAPPSADSLALAELEQDETTKIELIEEETTNTTSTSDGWGMNDTPTKPGWARDDTSGWGQPPTSTGSGWGEPVTSNASGWGDVEDIDEAARTKEEQLASWLADAPAKIKVDLPPGLSATHTTGIVERSLRRITNLIPIPANLPPAPPPAKGAEPDPADVEAQLERLFPKVVLTPWLNWDGGEMPMYSVPSLLETSQGPAVNPPYATRPAGEEAPKLSPGEVRKHDPANDDVTIMVTPANFEKLSNAKGMSVAGTFVQIVRKPKVDEAEGGEDKKKKKKSKKKANLWYIDDLAGVFPSFWSVDA